ncbi:DUF4238 domain-containing protein [Herbiconiux sp. P16]|uniref:DUF4238 domain-containing protein n=1 Tax=Herbiconiux wuyangfengii TaxID=3342794 RepID=UPI0035B7624A
MVELIQPYVSAREAERRAEEWLATLDRRSAVGARHHVVPRFLLARFASDGQLRVRRRADGVASTRSISDLAVRDFYTAVTIGGELDSSLESLFSVVETETAQILRQHLDLRSFSHPRPISREERATIDTFVAMQAVRGMRTRRMLETTADYTVKFLNRGRLSEEDTEELMFLPHPNDHLKMLGLLADNIENNLKDRPISIVRLDRPMMITGDEPVVLSQAPSDSPFVMGQHYFVHLQAHGRGFATAEAVLLALSPSAALLYGPSGLESQRFEMTFRSQEATGFAREHNDLVMAGSVDWLAASPEHPTFVNMRIPPPLPVVRVHDGGSPISARLNATPGRRPVRRLRPDDIDLVPEDADEQ